MIKRKPHHGSLTHAAVWAHLSGKHRASSAAGDQLTLRELATLQSRAQLRSLYRLPIDGKQNFDRRAKVITDRRTRLDRRLHALHRARPAFRAAA
jgi:hypothetical protein